MIFGSLSSRPLTVLSIFVVHWVSGMLLTVAGQLLPQMVVNAPAWLVSASCAACAQDVWPELDG